MAYLATVTGVGIVVPLDRALPMPEILTCLERSKAEAIIFPSNIASQKAFEKAGFKYHHTQEDGDAMTYVYG